MPVLDALQKTQVDAQIDERVAVGNRLWIVQMRARMPNATAWLLMRSVAVRCG
ncbi:MAG: hypothetical protein WHX52_19205 [Anaerolineae bacterium]